MDNKVFTEFKRIEEEIFFGGKEALVEELKGENLRKLMRDFIGEFEKNLFEMDKVMREIYANNVLTYFNSLNFTVFYPIKFSDYPWEGQPDNRKDFDLEVDIKGQFKHITEIIRERCHTTLENFGLFYEVETKENDLEYSVYSEQPQDVQPEKRTNQKTQILILKELGVFEKLAEIQNLTLEQKGQFISKLLNMNFDNAKDYLGNIYDTKGDSNKSPYNSISKKQAKEILNLIGLTLTK